MSKDVDCIILGAGVLGLALARELTLHNKSVLLLEQTGGIGNGVSSRNSEVIHAGIYYPLHSLKARLCVEGKQALYEYCTQRQVPVSAIGKLVVANGAEQEIKLQQLLDNAIACGVHDLQWLTAAQAQALEPELRCSAALLSPSTGIIDTHAYMLALQGDAEHAGAQCVFHTRFRTAKALPEGGWSVQVDGEDSFSVSCDYLINAGGLESVPNAQRIQGLPSHSIPTAYLCKGSYFSLAGKSPFKHLLYPMPTQAGLGVHLTLDLGGQARFGPDTEWLEQENYDVDPARARVFYDAVRQYWPALPDHALNPAYSGIRPKISAPGAPAADFMFSGPPQHGLAGLLNLYGMESPALTASLAIAQYGRRLLLNT